MKNYTYDPTLTVPPEIARMALELREWMKAHNAESIYGMGDVFALQDKLDKATDSATWLLEAAVNMQRELAETKAERDQFKHAEHLAMRLRARERRRQERTAGREEIPR